MTQQLTLFPTKTCTRCHETKSLDDFDKDRTHKDGLSSRCSDCRLAYRKATRQQRNEIQRAYRQANREQIAKRARAHREANREQINQQERSYWQANRERIAQRRRAHYQQNQQHLIGQKRVERYRRRARQQATVPQRWIVDHNLGDPLACWWCGRGLLGTTTHIDHVMPIKLGGPAHPNNEVTTCHTCNLRKSASHPLVWIAELTSRP